MLKTYFFLFLLSLSLQSQARNNVDLTDACESLARQATEEHDWIKYETDYNESKVITASMNNSRTIGYRLRVGLRVDRDRSTNSTYKVAVRAFNNGLQGVGTTLSCAVTKIEELRDRKI